jgi:hypothetical protein
MPVGRLLSLWRPVLRWTLFLLLLAGMAIVLEMVLPPQPRWTSTESLYPHEFTPDGRAIITTRLKADEGIDDSRPPVKAWDLATGQELARAFPDGFDIAALITIPTDGQDAVIQIQPHNGDPWELHLLDTTRLTARRVLCPDPYPDANDYSVGRIAKSPFAHFRSINRDRRKSARQALFDIEVAAIVDEGFPNQYLTEYIVNGPMLFYAKRVGNQCDMIFWDRRKPKAETIRLDGEVYVSGDNQRAVAAFEKKAGECQLKVWDLTSGTMLQELVTDAGTLHLSVDGAWAMIQREIEDDDHLTAVPDPVDHGARAVFWDLHEGRRIGTCPFERYDRYEVITVNGQPRLLTFAYRKSEMCLRDLKTLEPIWTRTWPLMSHLYWGRSRAINGLVCFSNDLEWLDLSTGKTRSRVTLAGPRFQGFAAGQAPRDIDATVSTDGRFAMLHTLFHEKEPPVAEVILAFLREKLGMRPRSTTLAQISVIDLESATLLMQTLDYSQEPLQDWRLSPDGQSLLVNSRRGGGKACVLECWDVPARKPWPWIGGVPLAFGLCSWSTRWTWRRWRKRRAAPERPQTPPHLPTRI